jgi:glycosyltransferase involved in cell wall biosynthesis
VSTPLLTVAIPTYNGARHLREALRSILAQEGVDFDLVISDDRSEDETLDLARAEAGDRARIESNSERLGLAGNWNRCVALSRTPWVAIFHQDDVMRPGHLAAHATVSNSDPTLGLICSATEVIDAEGRPISEMAIAPGTLGAEDQVFPPGAFLIHLATENPIRCSAVTTRVAAHAQVGGFDPSYRYMVDWEFWLRVARQWSVAWLARPSVAVRWHPASETHRFKSGTTDLDEAARLLAEFYNAEGGQLPDARPLRRRAEAHLARAFLNRAHDASRDDPTLARRCLRRALALRPGLIREILRNPHLAARLAWLLLTPKPVQEGFGSD